MASQRKKGKRYVGLWLDDKERAALNLLAKLHGKNKTQILREKIDEFLKTQKENDRDLDH